MEQHDNTIPHQAKHYYTLGTVGSSIVFPTVAGICWTILRVAEPNVFASIWWPLGFSFLVVYSAAFFIPEPEGWVDEGSWKLTGREFGYGFLMSLVTWATVVAMDRLLHPVC